MLGVFTGSPANIEGVIHNHKSKHACNGKQRALGSVENTHGHGSCHHEGRMETGHTAGAKDRAPTGLTSEQEFNQHLDTLRNRPSQCRQIKNQIPCQKTIVVNHAVPLSLNSVAALCHLLCQPDEEVRLLKPIKGTHGLFGQFIHHAPTAFKPQSGEECTLFIDSVRADGLA